MNNISNGLKTVIITILIIFAMISLIAFYYIAFILIIIVLSFVIAKIGIMAKEQYDLEN